MKKICVNFKGRNRYLGKNGILWIVCKKCQREEKKKAPASFDPAPFVQRAWEEYFNGRGGIKPCFFSSVTKALNEAVAHESTAITKNYVKLASKQQERISELESKLSTIKRRRYVR